MYTNTESVNIGADNNTGSNGNYAENESLDHGRILKRFLRNERVERSLGFRPRKRCLLPQSLVRSTSFMERFFAETGWHWLDAVSEMRATNSY